MNPGTSISFSPFHLALIFILIAVPATPGTTGALNARYQNCGVSFDCANIGNISYPFWGRNRPGYCGHPAFELDCTGESPVITILSKRFRILRMNLVGRSFTVARADFKDTICPQTLYNTTIDSTIFRFSSDSRNISIYYSCPSPATGWPAVLVSAVATNGFNCIISGYQVIGYWRKEENDTGVAPAVVGYMAACHFNMYVAVFRQAMRGTRSISSIINDGFGLEWDANNELCSNCAASGGRCGYDSGQFGCFCSGGVYPTTCRTGKHTNWGLFIGIAVGSVVAVVTGLLCAAYFVLRRRRHLKIANSRTKEEGGGGSILESGGTYMGVQVFSYQELQEATNDFDISKQLGDGGFGVVYHGKLRDGRVVAVKQLYERNFKQVEQFMNEVKILTRLRHPNLVTLYGCTSRRSRELLLVYEYIPNGTLADHLHGSRSCSGPLPWTLRLAIAVETAGAISYLHDSDIIHRDIKTTNILLDHNFHVKVADFGLSRLFPFDVTHVSTAPQGTPGYVDPVYHQCYHLTDKSDVYSFGVVLVELVSSKRAVDMSRQCQEVNLASLAMNKMQNQSLHELVDPCLGFEGDEEVRQGVMAVAGLAFRCLQPDRMMRPSMDEVVEGLKRVQSETDEKKNSNIINGNEIEEEEDAGGAKGDHVVHSLSLNSVFNPRWVSIPTASPRSL